MQPTFVHIQVRKNMIKMKTLCLYLEVCDIVVSMLQINPTQGKKHCWKVVVNQITLVFCQMCDDSI